MKKFTFVWFQNCSYSSDGNINVFEAETIAQAFDQFYEEYPSPDAEIVAIFDEDVQSQRIEPRLYHEFERF